ncbi:MAG: hypothetical protein A2X49_10410 [Lentisphaerae bacterium GWF2_52_8]|nr:MAG: hypothetical protein A2X49_10410 [Lentisphaerae bacterium GWF2_52_8]
MTETTEKSVCGNLTTLPAPGASPQEPAQIFSGPGIMEKLHLRQPELFEEGPLRYEISGMTGEGGTAKVFRAVDNNCDREIAIKCLKPSLEGNLEPDDAKSFLAEARITASLEHPNIVPVYDLDMDPQGTIYLAMRNIDGHPLKNYINNKIAGKDDPYVKNLDDVLRVFLKVCDALSFAHSKGRAHQDVKPENIMVGHFGEVFLIDWGASSCAPGGALSVTPTYMSPEQARLSDPSPAHDIYSLGVMLFYLLFLRPPTKVSDPKEIWEKRALGIIDPPTEEELENVPRPLASIVLKALDPDPEQRYQSVEEFAADIKNYQAGLPVSAYPDSFPAFLSRWYRRNRHGVMLGLLVAIFLLLFGSTFYSLKIKEIAKWGQPVFVDSFTGGVPFEKNWLPLAGEWKLDKGWILTDKGSSFLLFYKQGLAGNSAIEFDAQVRPGAPECDLSVVWCPGQKLSADPKQYYFLQAGANENTYSRILHQDATLAYDDFTIQRGKTYRIRAELDGNTLRLLVNGSEICHYESLFPLSEGHIGLYGFFPGKAFTNVRIYAKGVAEKVPVTAVGDNLFQRKFYREALWEYQKVAISHPETELAEEAIYKQGLCWMQLQTPNNAFALWKQLEDSSRYRPLVETHKLARDFELNRHAQVLASFSKLYKEGDAQVRQQMVSLWNEFIVELFKKTTLRKPFEQYVSLFTGLFPENRGAHYMAAKCFWWLGRNEDIAIFCPKMKIWNVGVLMEEGRFQEILSRYPDTVSSNIYALMALDQYDQLPQKYPDIEDARLYWLLHAGRFPDVLSEFPKDKRAAARVLLYRGDYQKVLDLYPDEKDLCALALLYLDKAQVLQQKYPLPDYILPSQTLMALDSYIAGKPAEAWKVFAEARDAQREFIYQPEWFDLALEPILRSFSGDKAAIQEVFPKLMETQRNRHRQRLWYLAAFVLEKISGEDFLAQPLRDGVQARYQLALGIKAEYNGQAAKALSAYQSYIATPPWRRDEMEPVIDRFVRWRISTLQQKR